MKQPGSKNRREAPAQGYPTREEQSAALRAFRRFVRKDGDYFAARAAEHRQLGFESKSHRAANVHHLLASLYEALADNNGNRDGQGS